MSRRLDEEKTAMDACVLDVALPLRSKLLAKVGRVLVLDILDDRVPAKHHVSLPSPSAIAYNRTYHLSLLT